MFIQYIAEFAYYPNIALASSCVPRREIILKNLFCLSMFDAIVAHALTRLIQNMQVWVKVLGGGSFVNMFQEKLKVMQGDTLPSQTAV